MSLHRALIKWVSGSQWTLLSRRCSDNHREPRACGALPPAWGGTEAAFPRSGGELGTRSFWAFDSRPAAPPPLASQRTSGPRRSSHPVRAPAPPAAPPTAGPTRRRPRPQSIAFRPLPAGCRRSEPGPGDSGSRRRGRSMGPFRGGLRCIKYLLLGFNLLFWVRPGAGRAGQGRGPGGGAGLGSPES